MHRAGVYVRSVPWGCLWAPWEPARHLSYLRPPPSALDGVLAHGWGPRPSECPLHPLRLAFPHVSLSPWDILPQIWPYLLQGLAQSSSVSSDLSPPGRQGARTHAPTLLWFLPAHAPGHLEMTSSPASTPCRRWAPRTVSDSFYKYLWSAYCVLGVIKNRYSPDWLELQV